MDSHADTCVGGANFIPFGEPKRTVNVYAFSEDYGAHTYPITSMATVWTNPQDGQPYLLVINEGIYCGDSVRHSLLTPNQLRANGVIVNDCPKQFDQSSTHSLSIPGHDLTIPLELSGVISSFETHKPTPEELHSLPTVELTSDTTWDPSSAHFAEAEASISAIRSIAYAPDADTRAIAALRRIDNPCLLLQEDEGDLYDRLIAAVCVASDDLTGQGTTGYEDPDIHPGLHAKIAAFTKAAPEHTAHTARFRQANSK